MTLVGLSGWQYKHWEKNGIDMPTFYTNKSSLQEYTNHFTIVEVNSSFYKNPTKKTIQNWKDTTPNNFKFIIKVNKYLTHSKKLSDWEDLFPNFHNICLGLENKLAGYLIQLPPSMTKSCIDKVISVCKFNRRYKMDFFFEFRNHSWFCQEVYDKLTYIANIVIVHQTAVTDKMIKGFSPRLEDLEHVYNKKHYFRLHGTWETEPYKGSYTDLQLSQIESLSPDIVIFDNTDSFDGQLELPGVTALIRTDMLIPAAVADAKKLIDSCLTRTD